MLKIPVLKVIFDLNRGKLQVKLQENMETTFLDLTILKIPVLKVIFDLNRGKLQVKLQERGFYNFCPEKPQKPLH